MHLNVVGCHGAASPIHRTATFVVNQRLALDAGSIAVGFPLPEQLELECVVVSHPHMDHVSDLASLTDTRTQADAGTLQIAGTRPTLDALRTHFFNDVLWPDFSRIQTSHGPTVNYRVLELETPHELAGLAVTPIAVDHTIDTAGFLIDDGSSAIAYSSDTRATTRIWELLRAVSHLKALILEVSFPDRLGALAELTGHLTPRTFAAELAKLPRADELSVLVYGMKPLHEQEIRAELDALRHPRTILLTPGRVFEF